MTESHIQFHILDNIFRLIKGSDSGLMDMSEYVRFTLVNDGNCMNAEGERPLISYFYIFFYIM